ncbi:hypothetical protein BLNAU_10691 [Blattamonas nauphoetae]|uniref:Uncharacterized protein n=1 Tax=Blattamonas nauphoetae TaxID=2049346 RepID=A0ABQ9XRL7_9EUKA|nr:hypothetical protein BLNAU_10691 [Blattamonas nauphoetae]
MLVSSSQSSLVITPTPEHRLEELIFLPLSNISFSTPVAHSISFLHGGSLSSMDVEGILNSGIVERLCARIESESSEVDLFQTLVVLDRFCCGLSEVIETEKSKTTDQGSSDDADLFSFTHRCELTLVRIEKAVLDLVKRVSGQRTADEKTLEVQEAIRGMIARYFRSSIPSATKEMGEMEELTKMNVELIEEGRQRREEQKRKAERKRKKEEEERKMKTERAAAIEVFHQDKFTLSGNVFTKRVSDWSSLFSLSFGPAVVRMTFLIRNWVSYNYFVGLIASDMVGKAAQTQGFFSRLERAASWHLYPSYQCASQNGKTFHKGSACKAVADGQRVVLEADGREGKRTLKLSQDGETQPVFFTNIPVPFRFGIQIFTSGASVEFVSTEVLGEASMVGGSLEVVMD